MPERRPAPDCLIVIFGASGDLTRRKLIPALYDLWRAGRSPRRFAVLGISRTKYTDESFRDRLCEFKPEAYADHEKWSVFASHIHYEAADATHRSGWDVIRTRVAELAQQYQTGQSILFYLSLSPDHFEPVVSLLGESGMVTEGRRWCSLGGNPPWQRVIVEKPFGFDPISARRLNGVLESVFDEQSIYRIDHYLAKELVQNLLVLRFANSIFEPIWKQNYIDHVQITASETAGVETRGGYYDGPAGGALRDMVQSHMLQILALVAMEPPVSLNAEDIRTEKVKVFKALRVPASGEVPQIAVRGQYGPGVIDGKSVAGYRESEGVRSDSQTDTFAAVKCYVDTWRWGGVPFYLRSGKAMAQKKTLIAIYFKPTPHILFRDQVSKLKANQILINVQPNEGIRLRFEGKVPGFGMNIKDVVMDFDYIKQWQEKPPDGYAALLHDCMRGDQTLFKHHDEVECAWNAIQPILDYWQMNPADDLPNYTPGSWGPDAADTLMKRENRYWHNE